MGERLSRLRAGDHLPRGLTSFDRSRRLSRSSRARALGEESRLLSGSLRFRSKDRLLALLPGDRVREGDLLCFARLSLRSGERLRLDRSRLGVRLLLLGLRPGLLLGDLFSFPEEASFEGDLRGFFSLSRSDRLDFLSLDRDLLSLDLPLKSIGDLDFLPRSRLLLSLTTGDFLLSLDLLLSSTLTLSSAGDLAAFPTFSCERLLRAGDRDLAAGSCDLLLLAGLLDFFLSLDLLLAAFSFAASRPPLLFFLSALCLVRSLDLLLLRFFALFLLSRSSSFPLAAEALALDRFPFRAFSWISPSSSEPDS